MYVCVVPIQTVNRIPTIARSAMKLVIVMKKLEYPQSFSEDSREDSALILSEGSFIGEDEVDGLQG